jgi:hypothetical protein
MAYESPDLKTSPPPAPPGAFPDVRATIADAASAAAHFVKHLRTLPPDATWPVVEAAEALARRRAALHAERSGRAAPGQLPPPMLPS